jgi:hypothetical protein
MAGGRAVVRPSIGAVLGVAVVAGYLVASGALDPLIGDAVTKVVALRARPAEAADQSGRVRAAKVADWQYFDDRPPWSSVRGVPQVPGPQDPVAPTRPAVAPPENPHRWNFYAPAPMPHHSLRPMTSCPQPRGPGHYVENFEVTSIKGGATVSWWDLNDPDLVSYELDAVPEYVVVGNSTRPVPQLPIKRLTIAGPRACTKVGATITGLTTGASYHIVLLAVNTSRVQSNLTYKVNRGTTDRVVIG